MNPKDTGLRVAGAIFGVMAIVQLLRVLINPEIIIAHHQVPRWPSVLLVVLLATLCSWLFRLSRLGPR